MYVFADTSALLNGCAQQYNYIWISPLVITELENIKTSNKDEHTKYLARQLVRDIISSNKFLVYYPRTKDIQHFIKKNKQLQDNNDCQILSAAALLAKEKQVNVTFVTSDGTLFLLAQTINILKPHFYEEKQNHIDYCGWNKYYPNEEEMTSLYTNPEINILKAKINEYCQIYEGQELKDILRWDGEKYRNLKFSNFKTSLGEKIQPRNLEQKMAFDLLQNRDIPVKLLFGNPGVGKDFLMLSHALDLVRRGEIDKIIFVRNLVPFKDAPEIGFLSGSLQEKISWGLGPVASILGEEGLLEAQEEGIIEAVNLGFIRGCSWNHTIVYVSEGQNITGGGYKLLVSRCGEGSQLWVNGDILQTDNKKFESNNGLERMIASLTDNKMFGTVKLTKTERSAVADLAKLI